ncbi:MAG: 2-dehydro-3-deoxygalactonokinase [Photobacterium frigidiphilum]|uniref:2-dehydro-3-deoxygalactonokinase n=1 Tax=Photobacterium frigidiphilum TaxID=264736 RepID=UPI0030020F15
MIITIDAGTTNTRVTLFDGKQRLGIVKAAIGVRNTSIDGNNSQLVSTISQAISQLKQEHNIVDKDIEAILAAGMITSNLGLVEVPHLIAPVSLQDFSDNIFSKVFPEISDTPIHFIPGVKNLETNNIQSIDGLDIMRGEEVEALAIADLFEIKQDSVIALPGSHSKFISIDASQAINGCCTTLAGELNSIITHHTILTSSLQDKFADTLCSESLLEGYNAVEKYGLGHALFTIRLNEQFGGKGHQQLANYLVGAILHSDIKALSSAPQLLFTPDTPIYIGGKGLLCEATAVLIRYLYPDAKITHCDNVEDLSAIGAIYVARQSGLVN